jgi:Domain of unknown function (DUF4396)
MEHAHHPMHHGHPEHPGQHQAPASLNRIALAATLHCLAGCAIGEVAGMVIGTALGWGNMETIILAVVLAFVSGFSLTVVPLLRNGYGPSAAVRVALAADTASITIMEIVDNLIMLVIPGAMDAPLASMYFWASLTIALMLAGVAAFPVNRWFIARGRGHALAHGHH